MTHATISSTTTTYGNLQCMLFGAIHDQLENVITSS